MQGCDGDWKGQSANQQTEDRYGYVVGAGDSLSGKVLASFLLGLKIAIAAGVASGIRNASAIDLEEEADYRGGGIVLEVPAVLHSFLIP